MRVCAQSCCIRRDRRRFRRAHRRPSRLARQDGLRGRARFERPWREQQSACSPSGAVALPYEQLHSSCQLLAVASDFSAHAWQRPVMASTSRSPAFAADPHSEQRGSKLRAFAFQSSQDMISRNLASATLISVCGLRRYASGRKRHANHRHTGYAGEMSTMATMAPSRPQDPHP